MRSRPPTKGLPAWGPGSRIVRFSLPGHNEFPHEFPQRRKWRADMSAFFDFSIAGRLAIRLPSD